ncbi:MAG: hypothetical protein Q8N03_15405 [Ignavibacteria bacterium]|nr:hypothetical protein [Ignavibacteria bacterium]
MKRVIFVLSILFLIVPVNSKLALCQSNSSSDQNGYSELEKINKYIVSKKNETNDIQYFNTIISKSNVNYYLSTKINIYVGYNGSEEWGLYYFPNKKYKHFLNLNYQFFTSFSPQVDTASYGLLNELGINTLQIYYKVGLIYHLNSNFYLNAKLGLGYTFLLGGSVLNDILIGVKFELKDKVFLQIESGINNLINIGVPSNPFLKMGIGFNL